VHECEVTIRCGSFQRKNFQPSITPVIEFFQHVISTIVRSICASGDVDQRCGNSLLAASSATLQQLERPPRTRTTALEKGWNKGIKTFEICSYPRVEDFLGRPCFQSLGVGCQSGDYGIDSCLLRICTSRTMSVHNVLPWRPKPTETVASEPDLLWTMHKREWQIDCTLQNQGRNGWSVRVLLNGLGFHARRFRTWADAIEGAEDKYAELVRAGWIPVTLDKDDNHRPL
jgi:hypothetical protein